MEKHNYWKKNPNLKLYQDLSWNIPEQKTGILNIIGGNSSNFSSVIHTAEYLSKTFPIKTLNILLPNSLKSKIPPLPGVTFLPATESGSFDKSSELNEFVSASDASLFIGDVSKNSATTIALTDAIKNIDSTSTLSAKNPPVILTRDAIDSITPELINFIEDKNLCFVGSLAQVQKVFRAVYYPKVLLLSMPLMSVVEALHKFTLSYNVTILTFHQEQIVAANSGDVITTPIEKTIFFPITLWDGKLAANIAAMNIFSPGKPLESAVFSIGYSKREL